MATRRNVPSKDVFRVIKGNLNKALEGSSNYFLCTRLLPASCFRNTDPHLNAKSLSRIWSLRSIIQRQETLPSLCAITTSRKTLRKFGSSVRSVSTSRTTPAGVPPYADVPLHLRDLESAHSAYPFFPQNFDTDPSVAVPKPSEEKGIIEHQLGIIEKDGSKEFLEDDISTTIDTNSRFEDAALTIPSYLAPDEAIPTYVPRKIRHYGKTIQDNHDPRHIYLYDHILLTRDHHGDGAALQVAEEILRCYVSTRLDQDWELAKRLYISLCYRFMSTNLRAIRNSLVKSMLQECPPRLEVVTLLVEKIESDREITTRHIHSYLTSFCEEESDLDLQLAEAEKILQSVREYSEFKTTQILLPLVRYAVTANDPDHARDLTKRLGRDYHLSINFSVLSEIVKGYARQGNMSAIDELLGDLHHQGFSRSKPYAFAALVRTVFHFLVPVRNPGRMFDFLTYTVWNHGLVPTTTLSVSVVKHFVASRRFDLIQRWTNAQRTWFPNILNPMDTPLAAYEINDAWTHISASPVDVLSTCKALAYGTLRNRFSEEFRYMTNNWLLNSLYKLSKQLILQTGIEEHQVGFKRFSNLDSMFECTSKLIKLASRRRLDTRKSLLVDTFRRKIEAAQETEFLVNRFCEYVQQYGPVLKFEEQNYPEPRHMKRQPSTSLLPRNTQRTTGHRLARMMIDIWNVQSDVDRDQRETVVDMLRYLQHQQRHRDCAILVQEFWKSGYVTGAFFTHEVIRSWVKMAYELRDPKMLHKALWAAIDSEPKHLIGYRFLMLIRAAVSVIMEDVHVGRMQQYPNQLEELKYLVSRCYRRRWQQDGCPKVEDIADPYLKRWKEEQEMSRKSFQIGYDYIL